MKFLIQHSFDDCTSMQYESTTELVCFLKQNLFQLTDFERKGRALQAQNIFKWHETNKLQRKITL